jgi:hypothetical protein
MPDTNFDLAPPPKDVDGLHAVPIDIQRVTARFAFDGATSAATSDATLEFTTGAEAGCPIFDLRQTIDTALLDGVAVLPSQLAHHDFGGEAGARLRVIESVLPPGTAHTLRLTYNLGPPQASTAGSYQPALQWSPGPRLRFNFGFTDLGPGRYLEAWVPANLIFDQFELILDVEVTNTPIAHAVITNGAVTVLGPNHWSVAFPAKTTAFSPLLEVRAADTVTSQTDTVLLPGSATPVTVEAWKLASSTVNLTMQIDDIKSFLTANATAVGPYLHGDKFVAFFVAGGMEYDGGTTTTVGPLRHETHHSWWGRGVKPASQPDAWWDEAWTVYATEGFAPLPWNAPDSAVELCSRNPWARTTAGAAYTSGRRFFQGAASLTGDPAFRDAMAAFYRERSARPATTLDLEAHLLCRTGREELVDGFHRWVYGFADAGTSADLWLRDDPGHTGTEAWAGRFWDSPDLWVRRADDGGTAHQDPVAGRDNWLYARVRNRGNGPARHFMVAFAVKQFAGTQFVYPNDFLPCAAATGGFELAPGAEAIVRAKWPAALVPSAGAHGCLLASVHAKGNHPVGGKHVWEENALAQKNLTIVALPPGGWVVIPVLIGHRKWLKNVVKLELRRPQGFADLKVSLLHPRPTEPIIPPTDAHADCAHDAGLAREPGLWTDTHATDLADVFAGADEKMLPRGRVARTEVKSAAAFPLLVGLRLQMPEPLKPKARPLVVDLVELGAGGKPSGGVAVSLAAKK